VQAVVKDDIGRGHPRHISFAGLVKVGVDARAHQPGYGNALTAHPLYDVGDHPCGGNDAKLAVTGLVVLLAASNSQHNRQEDTEQESGAHIESFPVCTPARGADSTFA
jgi:hypothetical protein